MGRLALLMSQSDACKHRCAGACDRHGWSMVHFAQLSICRASWRCSIGCFQPYSGQMFRALATSSTLTAPLRTLMLLVSLMLISASAGAAGERQDTRSILSDHFHQMVIATTDWHLDRPSEQRSSLEGGDGHPALAAALPAPPCAPTRVIFGPTHRIGPASSREFRAFARAPPIIA